MAVKERLHIAGAEPTHADIMDGDERMGVVSVEIINGNVVITVTREDEAKFGPVSVVVV